MKNIAFPLKVIITSVLATTFVVLFSIWLRNSIYDNQRMEVNIGEKYIFSYFWDNKDPFYFPRVDTVRVIDIKDGYVLFEDVMFENASAFSYQRSMTVKRFKHYARNIDVK